MELHSSERRVTIHKEVDTTVSFRYTSIMKTVRQSNEAAKLLIIVMGLTAAKFSRIEDLRAEWSSPVRGLSTNKGLRKQ